MFSLALLFSAAALVTANSYYKGPPQYPQGYKQQSGSQYPQGSGRPQQQGYGAQPPPTGYSQPQYDQQPYNSGYDQSSYGQSQGGYSYEQQPLYPEQPYQQPPYQQPPYQPQSPMTYQPYTTTEASQSSTSESTTSPHSTTETGSSTSHSSTTSGSTTTEHQHEHSHTSESSTTGTTSHPTSHSTSESTSASTWTTKPHTSTTSVTTTTSPRSSSTSASAHTSQTTKGSEHSSQTTKGSDHSQTTRGSGGIIPTTTDSQHHHGGNFTCPHIPCKEPGVCHRGGLSVSLAVDCSVLTVTAGVLPKGSCISSCATKDNKIIEYTFDPIKDQPDFGTAIAKGQIGLSVGCPDPSKFCTCSAKSCCKLTGDVKAVSFLPFCPLGKDCQNILFLTGTASGTLTCDPLDGKGEPSIFNALDQLKNHTLDSSLLARGLTSVSCLGCEAIKGSACVKINV